MPTENKKIPWWLPHVGTQSERNYINQALDNNFVNEGPLTTQFEKEISFLLGAKFAVAVPNCTAAIFLSLKALGVGPGDEVIVPDLTFVATANAVELTGAKPILVDIDPNNLNLSVDAANEALTDKTKAIVPVHVTGRAADLTAILALAKKHQLFVVEDAAEALLSKHNNKYLGTFGNTGCFSFSPAKTITTGQGGIIVTNDDELHVQLRRLKDQGRPVRGTGGADIHECIGYNFKFTDLQAAVGLGQLDLLPERTIRMKQIYNLYKQNLAGISDLTLFKSATNEVPQWTDIYTSKRDQLEEYLRQFNMDSRKYWFPVHTQAPYRQSGDKLQNSIKMSKTSLWLPSAFSLTDKEVLSVCAKIKEFFSK